MKRGLAGLTVAVLCLISLAIVGLAAVFVSLPDVTEMKKCVTTRLYHVHLCETDPQYTPLNKISPYIVGAVIMSEDASFYSHDGVDLTEMKEAAIKDFNEGRYARGASTITQQLAKNVFLTANKNILRKVEEIYLALQIEKHFTKSKIISLYLNVVEFGQDIYGVKAACRHYFGKPPDEITPEQAAFLAFLLPNPKKYSQSFARGHLTAFAEKMVRTILHKMELGHKISQDEYAEAVIRVPEFPWRAGSYLPPQEPMGSGTESDSAAGNPSTPATSENAAAGTGGSTSEMVESPTGVVEDKDATRLLPGQTQDNTDESDQRDNDFQFDFTPDDK